MTTRFPLHAVVGEHGLVDWDTLHALSDVDLPNDDGLSMLQIAMQVSPPNERMATRLVEHQADFNRLDSSGRSPFHYACVRGVDSVVDACLSENVEDNVVCTMDDLRVHVVGTVSPSFEHVGNGCRYSAWPHLFRRSYGDFCKLYHRSIAP